MSVTSGFFNSINGDRLYNAEQMSSIFDGIINDGVFANIGTAFSVQATTGNTVNVGTGRCWFNSTWLLNDATLPIELDDAEVLLDRIDAIVIEINHSESVRAGSIKVVNGTPSSTPTNPTMTHTDYINQYPIAYIMRSANSESITQANITYTVGSNACPFITGILSVVSIQNIVAQWENEFDTWLDSLSAMLDDNTAANLANQILELKEQFDTLAKEKKIYSELEDSTGEDTIDDSTGAPILGTTAMYSDEGSSESIPGTATGGDPYKVGDTLTTARIDLGAKWLLCNGDSLDSSLYPELANVLPSENNLNSDWTKSSQIITSGVPCWLFYNGQYAYVINNGDDAVLYYSNSIEGEWSSKSILTGYDFVSVNKFLYLNGYYIICGSCRVSSSSSTIGFYAYSTSLDGSWTVKTVSNTFNFNSVAYAKNPSTQQDVWVFAGCAKASKYSAIMTVTNSLSSGSFTIKTISTSESESSYEETIYDVVYGNGLFFAVGNHRTNNSMSDNEMRYVWVVSSDFGASWTSDALYSYDYVAWLSPIPYVRYINGLFVILLNSGTRSPMLYFTDNPLSDSNWKNDNDIFINISADGYYDMIYENGNYILCGEASGHPFISYSSSLDNKERWESNLKILDETDVGPVNYIAYANGTYIACGYEYVYSLAPGEIFLPSISLSDKTYTYIRAKE